jgi:small conductance mechanosensitive channel
MWTLAPLPVQAENSSANLVPITTSDPEITVEELDIIAAPLTVDELTVEADGWLELVKTVAHKVADIKVRIRQLQEKQTKSEAYSDKLQVQLDESEVQSEQLDDNKSPSETMAENLDNEKDLAMDELTNLRSKRKQLIDRLNIILERINQKIGLDENGKEKEDVLVYRRYITAVGGIKIYANDNMGNAFGSIKGWILSKQGGRLWVFNIVSFFSIIIFFWIIGRFLSRATRKGLKFAGKQSKLLTEFLVGMTSRIMLMIGFIVALSALNVDIGPLLAMIGAAGFVVAFALQNTLSNFASGIMIMLYRPFDVDDIIEVAGISGKVSSLNLVTTTVTTFDNKRMVVPNNDIWGNVITNATASTERRVDMVFGIGYEDDIDLALQVLEEIAAAHPLILTDPAPVIQLHELADSSVNFICRPWAKTSDYWTVYWDITRSVKERFDAEGLSIPFPQRDIHIYQEQKSNIHPIADEKHGNTASGSNQMGLEHISNNDD